MVYACARLANSASLLLPVSNLTNLLALPVTPDLSFLGFALLMAPVLAGGDRRGVRRAPAVLRRDLARTPRRRPAACGRAAARRTRSCVVGLMLVGFAALSPLGVEPAWVAGAAAVVLSGYALARRRVDAAHACARPTHLSFAVFVLCLGVVVAALTDTFLGDLVARRSCPDGDGLVALRA